MEMPPSCPTAIRLPLAASVPRLWGVPRGASAVARRQDSAALSATRAAPRVDLDLPHAGEEHTRIRRIHDEIGRARGVVDEQDLRPGLAPVGRSEDAAFGLRAVGASERRDVNVVGIFRVNDDARDASRVLEACALPVLAGVRGFPHAPAKGDVASDEGFSGAGPYDVRIGGS